jgi:integrase/recombinase XerD
MSRRKKLTWKEAAARFRTHLQARNLSPRSVYCYGLEVERLAAHLPSLRPDQVRTDDLRAYQVGLLAGTASRSGRPLSGRSAYRVACNLASFFRWLKDDNAAASDPTARLERPKLNQPLQGSVLSVEEVRRLLDAVAVEEGRPTGLRDRALVEVLYATGVRRAELIDFDVWDFEARERVLCVRHGKGDKGRPLPVTRAAALWIERYLAEGRPRLARGPATPALFLTRFGKRIGEPVPMKLLHRLAKAAGIAKAVTPHTFRRAFATHLLQNGVSLRHIQKLLGHEKLSTTAAYLCLSPEELREQILLHHPRERLAP